MNTYDVACIRRAGSSSPIRSVIFEVDAASADQAEYLVDDQLARMASPPEMDIDSVTEMGSRP